MAKSVAQQAQNGHHHGFRFLRSDHGYPHDEYERRELHQYDQLNGGVLYGLYSNPCKRLLGILNRWMTALSLMDSLKAVLDGNKKITGYVERIESFALSATRETTKGAMVVGTDPEAEKRMTHLDEHIDSGEYFLADDKAVLIGAGLAEYP